MTRLLVCLFLLAPALIAQEPTVTSVFKDPVKGAVTKLDVQGRLEIKVQGSEVPERVPLDEVEEIAFPNEADEVKPEDAPLRVYLVNGDVLRGTPTNGPEDDDEKFILKGTRFSDLTIHVQLVKRVEVVSNVRPNVLPELGEDAEYDVAYFAATEREPEQADPVSELVRIVEDGAYLYNEILHADNYEGSKSAWNRLRGVVCLRDAGTPYDKLMGIFTLRDGSVMRGAIKKWGDGKVVIEHTVLDEELTLEEVNLVSVTMKNGRYAYVSDKEFGEDPEERPYYLPKEFDYSDYLFKVRRDRAQGGGPISIDGKVYAKGLGVHAISRLTFNLNRGYSRFVSDIGVDDSAGDKGSVVFKVYADGELIYESEVLRGTAPARSIDLDVLNVRQLVLEVTAGDDDDIFDRANWANAKVVR